MKCIEIHKWRIIKFQYCYKKVCNEFIDSYFAVLNTKGIKQHEEMESVHETMTHTLISKTIHYFLKYQKIVTKIIVDDTIFGLIFYTAFNYALIT